MTYIPDTHMTPAAELVALRQELAAANARTEAARADLAGLLQEWMDTDYPGDGRGKNMDHARAWHQEFFRLKAAACGLPWPLTTEPAGIAEKGGPQQ